jgi:hypothetical protein
VSPLRNYQIVSEVVFCEVRLTPFYEAHMYRILGSPILRVFRAVGPCGAVQRQRVS